MDILGIGSFVLAAVSTGIAIYQWAVINESKKRRREFQFLLAGINNAALQKQAAWANQISTLTETEIADDIGNARVLLRAKDDFSEIAQLTVALEGTIDPDSSAISELMDKSIEIVRKNNELQNEGLKNPMLQQRAQQDVKPEAQHEVGQANGDAA